VLAVTVLPRAPAPRDTRILRAFEEFFASMAPTYGSSRSTSSWERIPVGPVDPTSVFHRETPDKDQI